MILVDTSVWVDFLRTDDRHLADLLETSSVCIHPVVIGELACGNLKNRKQLMALWRELPKAIEASHDEALHFLEHNALFGKGIGFVDLHLLASTALTESTRLWTRDRRLQQVAMTLNIAYAPA